MEPINCEKTKCPFNNNKKCGIPDDENDWTITWLARVVRNCKDEVASPFLSSTLIHELDLVIASMQIEPKDQIHRDELRVMVLRDLGDTILTNANDIIHTLSN